MRFSGVHDALQWAYNTSLKPVVSLTPNMDPKQTKGGLTRQERHAQAALIIGAAERALDPLQLAFVRVYYGRQESGDAMMTLTRHVVGGLPTGIHGTRGVLKIVLSYCGRSIGIHAIRTDLRCKMDQAKSMKESSFDRLEFLRDSVIRRLNPVFDEREWLRRAEEVAA